MPLRVSIIMCVPAAFWWKAVKARLAQAGSSGNWPCTCVPHSYGAPPLAGSHPRHRSGASRTLARQRCGLHTRPDRACAFPTSTPAAQ